MHKVIIVGEPDPAIKEFVKLLESNNEVIIVNNPPDPLEDIMALMDSMDNILEKNNRLDIHEPSLIELSNSLEIIAYVPEKRNHKAKSWEAPYKFHK